MLKEKGNERRKERVVVDKATQNEPWVGSRDRTCVYQEKCLKTSAEAFSAFEAGTSGIHETSA
jgi:hypothetical protein